MYMYTLIIIVNPYFHGKKYLADGAWHRASMLPAAAACMRETGNIQRYFMELSRQKYHIPRNLIRTSYTRKNTELFKRSSVLVRNDLKYSNPTLPLSYL